MFKAGVLVLQLWWTDSIVEPIHSFIPSCLCEAPTSTEERSIPRPRSRRFRSRCVTGDSAERAIPRNGRFRDRDRSPRPLSRWILRPPSRRFRDRGAVDVIAVGRAAASAASPRATRGTANHHAPTAERSHCIAGRNQRYREPRSHALLAGKTMAIRNPDREVKIDLGASLIYWHGGACDARCLWD